MEPLPTPVADRVLLRRREKATMHGSLHLPATMRADPNIPHGVFAEVLAVGPGRVDKRGTRVPVGVAVGDVVILSGFVGGAAVEVEWRGEPVLLAREELCLGVVEE